MEKRTGPSGNGKKRVDKIIISAELDAEIDEFIKQNAQIGIWTKEMDAILIKMRRAKISYRKIASFITGKFRKLNHSQCNNRWLHLKEYGRV